MPLLAQGLLIAAALSSAPPAAEQVVIDGTTFTYASSSKSDGATLVEFVAPGESIDHWERLVSIQCHPSATALKDVINPYLEARKDLIAVRPEFLRNKPGSLDDLSIVLFLGKPGMPQLEFVIARFAEAKPAGVAMVAYSRRFPMGKNVDVSAAMEGKSRWKDQLASISLEQIATSCALASPEPAAKADIPPPPERPA